MIVKVYVNNQVLLPAVFIKCLGVEDADYVDVVVRYGFRLIEINGVRLLKPAVVGGVWY